MRLAAVSVVRLVACDPAYDAPLAPLLLLLLLVTVGN